MTKDSSLIGCNICIGSLLVFSLVGMIPYLFIPAEEWNRFKRFECHVERIVYPERLPSHDNMTGWGACDCGRRCESWSPCIDIYTNVSDSIRLSAEFYEINDDCTFHQDECPDGEDSRNLEVYLNQARDVFQKYNNRTLECFYNDDGDLEYIFLEKEWDWELTIGFLVVFGILLCCLGCINWDHYRNIRAEKKSNEILMEKV